MEIRLAEVRFAEDHPDEERRVGPPVEVRLQEVCPAKVRVAEIRPREVRLGEIRLREVRTY